MDPLAKDRGMSPADLARLGLYGLAYVKPIVIDGQPGFAVHAADGGVLGVLPTAAQALAAIRRNDLKPASVH